MRRRLDGSQRASEILALNEILKRQRPDLRFVPLESLIGLVVRKRSQKEPARLRELFKVVQRQEGVSREDLPAKALELMLDMPPEQLPEVDLPRFVEERTGFRLSSLFPPVSALGLALNPLVQEAARSVGVDKAIILSCIAASPFLARAVVAGDPRIRAGGLAAAIACGVAIGEPF